MPLCTIVGVGPGIGLAVAKKFASQGYDLAITSRNAANLGGYRDELVHKFGVSVDVSTFDVRDRGEALMAIQEYAPKTNVFVYNVAKLGRSNVLHHKPVLETLAVGLGGAQNTIPAVLRYMRERGSGTILFTGGGFAHNPDPEFAALSIDKAALRCYAKILQQQERRNGIKVGMVTVHGKVEVGGQFDPDLIAQEYWNLYSQDASSWEFEKHVGPF